MAKTVRGGDTAEAEARFFAGTIYESMVWDITTSISHFVTWVDAVAPNA